MDSGWPGGCAVLRHSIVDPEDRNSRARHASPRRGELPTAACLLAFCALPPRALAHGSVYLPPAAGPAGAPGAAGPGPAAGAPAAGLSAIGPATSTGGGSGRATWEDWWHFNKDPYLELKRAVGSGLPATAADDILAGRPRNALASPEILRSRVAPALRALLETERSPEIVAAALVALARVSGPKDIPTAGSGSTATAHFKTSRILESRLADPNQEIAETAALSLGIAQSEDSLPALEALLAGDARGRELSGGRDVSLRTRAFAAYGLGLVGAQARNNRTRQIVARALCAALAPQGNAAGRRASSSDVEVAAVIALSLDRLDPERQASASGPWISLQTEIGFLRRIFADEDRPGVVRAHAATALARLAQESPADLCGEVEEKFLEVLRARMRLDNVALQSTTIAIGVLGAHGSLVESGGERAERRLRNALEQVLGDADVQARCFALIALAELGAQEFARDDADEGPAACRSMITAELLRGRGVTRPWAAIALGVLERRILDASARRSMAGVGRPAYPGERKGFAAPVEKSREILRGYFAKAKQRTHIGAGAIALGLCRDRRAMPLLLEKLGAVGEDQGRGYVALALGMIGDGEAAGPLQKVARASKYKPEILEQAAIGLALLGDKSMAPELTVLLANAQGQAAQASLAMALGRIGDERTIDPLLKLIERKDLTSSARAFATAALGLVADTDPMPWYVPISVDLNYVASTGTLLAGDGSGLLEIL